MANDPPDDAPAPRVTSDEVLAWIAETGKGSKAAAKHFSIPESTVKSMRRRARELAGDTKETRAAAKRAVASMQLDGARETVDLVRDDIHDAIRHRARLLADPASMGLRNQKDTALAFAILVDKFKVWVNEVAPLARGSDDVDGDSARDREAAAARVRAAMGVDPGPEDGP